LRALRLAILAILVLACGCIISAQDRSASQPVGQQPATTTPGRNAGHPTANHAIGDHPIQDGQSQLVHASNEAAGEEKDETREFRESASVKWIASHTGLSLQAAYWVLVILNFVVIAALVVWGWKKNVPAAFRARSEGIRKNLEEARRASEEANRRLSDIEARLSRLDGEIAEMRTKSETEAAAEEDRIKAAAEEDRRKVIEGAEQEIATAARAARRDLKAYVAGLAVSLAEKRIQVDAATDQALVDGFVRGLSREPSRNGGKGGR
jgi:F-type H+-transporting ATPase subunit b